MKYRVEITHCYPQIDNTYNLREEEVKIVNGKIFIYIENEEEAYLISNIEYHQRKALKRYRELLNLKGK